MCVCFLKIKLVSIPKDTPDKNDVILDAARLQQGVLQNGLERDIPAPGRKVEEGLLLARVADVKHAGVASEQGSELASAFSGHRLISLIFGKVPPEHVRVLLQHSVQLLNLSRGETGDVQLFSLALSPVVDVTSRHGELPYRGSARIRSTRAAEVAAMRHCKQSRVADVFQL